MNLRKCNNGHFFDGDKYPSCPHCGGSDSSDSAFGQDVNASGYSGSSDEDMPTVPGAGIGTPTPIQPAGSGFPTGPTMPGVIPGDTPVGVKMDLDEDLATQGAGLTFNPVVGWLVVKNGEDKGRSKMLTSGKNFVGRDSSMDVVLNGDKSISRIKHAIILYEPNARRFIAIPGESHELFYVNNEVVLNNVELNAYDVITIGKTELIFVPFCGDNFAWEEIE
ncbi:MAG: FHA domain-containing protein [Eubacterium sp.]|nr:FHA domain-containing protein [Eubacterium sp.]